MTSTYKAQLERTEIKLGDATLQLNASKNHTTSVDHLREIERLKATLLAEQATSKGLNGTLVSREGELVRLRDRLERAEGGVRGLEDSKTFAENKLGISVHELRVVQELLGTTRKRTDVLEEALAATVKEKDRMQRTLITTDGELRRSKSERADLQEEVRNLSQRVDALLRQITKDGDNTKLALEKSITASLRLCVVAPTVNVHVSDRKYKFKSGLPKEALQQFLSTEVLSKYSFLFKQKSENSAPNGTNLEPWLQSLLGQMQTSIENHVNSAMDGSSL